MKVKIIFDTEKEEITIFYRSFIMSLIKQALQTSDPEYFKKLYYWDGKKNKWTKPFCFAVGFPKFQLHKDVILCNKQFNLNISSSDYEFLVHLTNGLLQDKLYPFRISNNNSFTFHSSVYIKDTPVVSEQVTFRTLSPILIEKVENGKKEPVLPFDDGFLETLNIIADMEISSIRYMQTGQKQGLKKRLEFEPLKIRKEVIKHKINDFINITGKNYMTLTGFSGSFILKGHPDDLNVISENGLGLRRSQGFGFVEVI